MRLAQFTANSVAGLACRPAIAMSETRQGFCIVVLHASSFYLVGNMG